MGVTSLDTAGWSRRTLAPTATLAQPGVAYSQMVDTLIGYLGLDIAGTSAEAQGYARATAHNGIPYVAMDASGTTQIGYEIPYGYELSCNGLSQGHSEWCGDAVARSVNCDDPSGSNIEGTLFSLVQYTPSGALGDGFVEDSKDCGPASGGGSSGGGGGGSSPNCTTYIIEGSNDGGVTWFLIAMFTVCDN